MGLTVFPYDVDTLKGNTVHSAAETTTRRAALPLNGRIT